MHGTTNEIIRHLLVSSRACWPLQLVSVVSSCLATRSAADLSVSRYRNAQRSWLALSKSSMALSEEAQASNETCKFLRWTGLTVDQARNVATRNPKDHGQLLVPVAEFTWLASVDGFIAFEGFWADFRRCHCWRNPLWRKEIGSQVVISDTATIGALLLC